jgi:hypothetical protein
MATNSKNDPAAVDAYLATLPARERETLQRLRTLIEETLPHVEERISYGTTVMFSLGRDLVGFVSQSDHVFAWARPGWIRLAVRTLVLLHSQPGADPGNEKGHREASPRQRRHDSLFTGASAASSTCEEDTSGERS